VLEKVDLKLKLSKSVYKRRLSGLQSRLFDLEHAVFLAKIPVAIVIEGWAASGKGATVRLLAERLDPRAFRVVPVTPPRTFEMQYPWLWRFWLKVPARGQIVVFDSSWYRRVLGERVTGITKKKEWQRAYQDIAGFEEQLAADGMVIIKLWMHISEKEQAKRFKKLLGSKLTQWQVSDEDRAQHKAYDEYLAAVEEMLARTDSPHASWVIVEATDHRHARRKVFETIIGVLETKLGARANGGSPAKAKRPPRSTRAKAAKAKRSPRSTRAKAANTRRSRRGGAAAKRAPKRKR
jgi:AMP-polyphosphate phosphotransferase